MNYRLFVFIIVLLLSISYSVHAEYTLWTGLQQETIRSVTLTENGIEVIRTKVAEFFIPEGGTPEYAYKDIYIVKDGKLVLFEEIKGFYYPPSMKEVPANYKWK